ncbi:hypothetical protein [Saezia sanguinis]
MTNPIKAAKAQYASALSVTNILSVSKGAVGDKSDIVLTDFRSCYHSSIE